MCTVQYNVIPSSTNGHPNRLKIFAIQLITLQIQIILGASPTTQRAHDQHAVD